MVALSAHPVLGDEHERRDQEALRDAIRNVSRLPMVGIEVPRVGAKLFHPAHAAKAKTWKTTKRRLPTKRPMST